MTSSRRAFLGAAATLMVAGCSSDVLGLRRSVRVAVSWSGQELRAFHEVLDGLGELDYPVEVVPLGDDISTAFGARSTRRPDVVMLPQPGLVPRHLHNLEPIPDDLADRGRAQLWAELLVHDGTTYGVPFKTAHKSAVWYRPSVFREVGVQPPQLWSDWLTVNRSLSLAGIRPLSLAAGDGWVLTDFFENVLLGIAPTVYSALATADSRTRPVSRRSLQRFAFWARCGRLRQHWPAVWTGRSYSSSLTQSSRSSATAEPPWSSPPTSPSRWCGRSPRTPMTWASSRSHHSHRVRQRLSS